MSAERATGARDFTRKDEGFARRIDSLRAERGESVAISQIGEIVEALMTTLEGDLSAFEIQAQRELQQLVDYIRNAKSEIAAIGPADIPQYHIPVATDELDAVVQATEQATDAILDAAEQLNAMAAQMDGPAAGQLQQIATRIYEASNFQDVTGQRINKVVKTLRHIEMKVVQLAQAFGHELTEIAGEPPPPAPASDEASLLNGPQLPDKANSQDDIDALLASFD